MANNRMWLVNTVTGHRVLLAKYYPSTGWCCFHDDLSDELAIFLDGEGREDRGGMYGGNDWELEYEVKVKRRRGARGTINAAGS